MKKFILWSLAIIITLGAAYYQRKTGPTYPKSVKIDLNNKEYNLKLLRSLGLDERPEIKLHITDRNIKARLYYKRFRTADEYEFAEFIYKEYPVESFVMNKVFKITHESGYFAAIPQQPPAGKLQYYIELTDSAGTRSLFRENPVVIRFKGAVPASILTPHIIFMFLAMLFSTLAGLMSLAGHPQYRKYSFWTLMLLIAGGMILGPIVQKHAFGELWTGIPFGWDLTDNKTLIALIFWIIAVYMNNKKKRPFYAALAASVLLLVYSIPHSLFGSELDFETGQVIQGLIIMIPSNIKNFIICMQHSPVQTVYLIENVNYRGCSTTDNNQSLLQDDKCRSDIQEYTSGSAGRM